MQISSPEQGSPDPHEAAESIGRPGARTSDPLKIIYIAGAGRSGSTLLARTLGRLDGFFPAGEVYHLFGRGADRNELCGCGRSIRGCSVWGRVLRRLEAEGLLADAARMDRVRRRLTYGTYWPLALAPRLGRRLRSDFEAYERTVREVYRVIREVTECRVIVDSSKSPAYGGVLLGLPGVELCVVHLVRDSRGVAYSWQKVRRRPGAGGRAPYLNRRGTLGSALLWSAAHVAAEALAGRAHRRVTVRYSDFVRRPHETLRAILGALGEHAAGDLAHVGNPAVHLGSQHVIAGNPLRLKSGSIVLREDLEWEMDLGPTRRAVVTALTAPLLLRYGYLGSRGPDGRKAAPSGAA